MHFEPTKMNAAAQDMNLKWYQYEKKPVRAAEKFDTDDDHIEIPTAYAPEFSGDWKDSLILKPGYVEKSDA